MKSKIIVAIQASSLALGMFALSGCFESTYYPYGYGSGYSSTYVPAYRSYDYAEGERRPVYVGRDYDEHRDFSYNRREAAEPRSREREEIAHNDNHRIAVERHDRDDRGVH